MESHLHWVPGSPLIGERFLSLGLLASSLTENQIIAGFVGFGMILFMWLIRGVSQGAGETFIGSFFSYLSVGGHFDNFVNGLIDTRDLIYLSSLIIAGLFLTHRVMDSQRWK